MDIVMSMSTLDLSLSLKHALMGLLKIYAYLTTVQTQTHYGFWPRQRFAHSLVFLQNSPSLFLRFFSTWSSFRSLGLPKMLSPPRFPFQICLYAPFHLNTWSSHLKRSLLKRLLYEGFSQISDFSYPRTLSFCIGPRIFLSIQCLYLQML